MRVKTSTGLPKNPIGFLGRGATADQNEGLADRQSENRRRGVTRWNVDEEEYLKKNYHALTDDVLAGVLKKSRRSVAAKAYIMGLQKDGEAVEANQPQRQVKYREETPLLADIICFYHRRNMKVGDIAKDVHCPPRQVREILERCMDNGMYERYAKVENSAIQFKPCREWSVTIPVGNGRIQSLCRTSCDTSLYTREALGEGEVRECEVI